MTYRKLATALTAASLAASPLAAQSPEMADETVKMEKLEVTDVPIEQQILPTSRPFNSVFGTADNIMATPRNVTIISREQLNAISIQDVRDFAKLTSSSYTRTNFGAPGNPDIRGQSADVFMNGMRERITSNGNGMPIDFNSVESVNIVKGPATAVQGVSTYVGGFVDLITKRPFFDQQKSSAYATVGSYETYRWGVDTGGPVSDKLAYRVSYSGEDSEGYFYDSYTKKQSLYGAVSWKPSSTYELFVNAQASYMEYVENFGINRPTQNLIDNGLYRTGTNINGGTSATAADPQNATNIDSGGSPFNFNTIAYGAEVPIDRRSRLLRPGDNSIGRNFKVQAIQSFFTSPDLTIVNNNLFTYTRRETLSSYHYSEIIDPSYTMESRLEFQKKLGEHSINFGVSGRYQKVKAYADFFFEPAAAWDITKDRNAINAYNSIYFPTHFAAYQVPGWEGRYGSSWVAFGGESGADGNISSAIFGAPFAQASWSLSEKLKLHTGVRFDFGRIKARDPFVARYEDTIDVALPNANVSLNYSFTPKVSAYATYNYSENTSGAAGNGGGYGGGYVYVPASDTIYLDKEAFSQASELVEVGSKYSLLGEKLFVGASLFQQTRQQKQLLGPLLTYRYRGFEAETNFQPNKRIFATFSWALIEATAPASAVAAGFDPVRFINPAAPEVQAVTQTEGRIKVQGAPRNQFNALFSYKFDSGFGFSANGTLHDEINNNWAGTLVIPWQFAIDSSVYYTTKTWEARLTVLNVTDEKNWAPNNGTYGNASIFAEPGTRAEFTVTYKF